MAFLSKKKANHNGEKALLALELAEIKEISDVLFQRIEKKIRVMEAVEASLDKKVAALERLLRQTGSVRGPAPATVRQREVFALAQRGMGADEIAEVLDMPAGEVELILELSVQNA